MARQAAARRADTRRLLGRLWLRAPHRALVLWRALTWAQRAIAYRERVRLKQARLYTRVRDIARAIGRRLVEAGHLRDADDVFWLTWQEIDELSDGRAMLPGAVPELVALRQREHACASAMSAPDTFEIGEGTYVTPEWLAALSTPPAGGAGPTEGASRTLTGTSACGGRVTGRAAVLGGLDDAYLLTQGDLLVTRQTDPGWGPLFCLVSGLVIERGGMLSHGAIIAREFGLPCVVGVKDATRLVAHGARVTVDGDRGTCTLTGASA
jgi:pyruvate,water dikinase